MLEVEKTQTFILTNQLSIITIRTVANATGKETHLD